VNWTAPSGRPPSDWVALYRAGDPVGNYLWWQYTNGTTSGSASLVAPTTPGTYEFRYLLENGYTQAAVSPPVTVTGGGGGGGSYTLNATPSSIPPGGSWSVTWTAPGGSAADDWIGLFRVGDPDYSFVWYTYTGGATTGTVSVPAPSTSGSYELRYFINNTYNRTATSNTVTVSGG
jgi:Ca-activated chloride channel family protein